MMAIVGLILGIIGVVGIAGFWVPFVGIGTFIVSLIALIFGAIAMKKPNYKHHGMAVAALVLGIIGVVLNVPSSICGICTLSVCTAAEDATSFVVGLLAL